jgi:hypothetical protein
VITYSSPMYPERLREIYENEAAGAAAAAAVAGE